MSESNEVRDSLFREEALQEYARVRSEGALVRVHPAWSGWVFWWLIVTFAAGVLFAVFARVDRLWTPAESPPPAAESGSP
jgi:hypothetical protein